MPALIFTCFDGPPAAPSTLLLSIPEKSSWASSGMETGPLGRGEWIWPDSGDSWHSQLQLQQHRQRKLQCLFPVSSPLFLSFFIFNLVDFQASAWDYAVEIPLPFFSSFFWKPLVTWSFTGPHTRLLLPPSGGVPQCQGCLCVWSTLWARLEFTSRNCSGTASGLMQSDWKVKMFYKVYKYLISTEAGFFFFLFWQKLLETNCKNTNVTVQRRN